MIGTLVWWSIGIVIGAMIVSLNAPIWVCVGLGFLCGIGIVITEDV